MVSPSGTIYIGVTNSLVRRVLEHKEKAKEGFTKKYSCNKLVYYECFGNIGAALFREKEIKKWRREKKQGLIKKLNPHWQDLSKEF
jgi:putative endonuclease